MAKQILVLEDTDDIRPIIQAAVTSLGPTTPCEINWVRTKVEALAATGKIDAFVADIAVYSGKAGDPAPPSTEHGIEAIRGLILSGAVTPEQVIVVSKYKHDAEIRSSLISIGINMARNTFEKPVDPPVLTAAIARVLGR